MSSPAAVTPPAAGAGTPARPPYRTTPFPLLRATHPLPSVAVTAFVTALAVSIGVPAGKTALLAAAVLVGQFSVGWANDGIDADRDRLAGRRDKPVATGEVRRETVLLSARLALLADVPLSLAVGWRAGAAHLIAVGWAWWYDAGLKSSPLSVAPYVVGFGLVPVVVAASLPGAPTPRPLVAAAAVCCGIAAHFANTVGDAADDARTGVRGLPQRVGETASVGVAAAGVGSAAVLVLVAVGDSPAPLALASASVACAVATGLALGRRRTRRLAFRLVLAAVGLLVVGFVTAGGDALVSGGSGLR